MGVNPTYVFNWTRSKSFINQLNQVMMNQAQPSLRVPWLLNFYLEVPQKHVEQKLIATVLSDVDALLEALEQQIAKKRLIKQGAMQELLTGKRRLPGVSGEWKKTRFGEITQPRKDRIEPRLTGGQDFCVDLEHIGQGTGILTGHTTANEGSSTKSVFHKGDILFGKLRAYLRKYWLAEQDGVCSTEIWVLASNHSKIIPEFLYQLVKMDQFIEVASTAFGTHMPRSDWNVVKNYLVNLPTLNEQIAIVAILSDMDSEIVAFEEQLRKINLLKQGMMQELLTGKTRLL
jgi:type I restriction enzyme S subunit